MQPPNQQPPEIWTPLTGMPEGAQAWLVPGHAELSAEWADIRASLKDRDEPRAFIDNDLPAAVGGRRALGSARWIDTLP